MAKAATPEVSPDINRFVMETGRLPRIGDPVPPWRYRGWLMWINQLADHHPQATGRWSYYMRTLEAGKLLDEPIPQIEFASSHEPRAREGYKMIEKALDILFNETGSSSVLTALVDWLAFANACSFEPPRLKDEVQEKLYRHWNLEPLLTVPSDHFGTFISEFKGNGWRNPSGFYPTPHTICEFMVRMVMADIGEKHHIMADGRDSRLNTVCDPCVGTGWMLLHASNHSFCLYGQDIDPLVCKVTMINGVMYAPWLTFPLPQKILDTGIHSADFRPAALTHRDIAPPPAPLPGMPAAYCVDDRSQGLLFDDLFALNY